MLKFSKIITGISTNKKTTLPRKLICTSGIIGNILVLFVIGLNPQIRRKPINIFILHQSAVDLLGCFVMNLRLIINNMSYVQNQSETIQTLYCNMWMVSQIHLILFGVSGYNIVALSIERHQAITKPFQYDEDRVRLNSFCSNNAFSQLPIFAINAFSRTPLLAINAFPGTSH